MSGKVVKAVGTQHKCAPGWQRKPLSADSEFRRAAGATMQALPPTPSKYPAGTVWECDCGKTWVSTGAIAVNAPGICGWKREGRWAKRRRIKREAG